MRKRLLVGAGLLLGAVGIALLLPWSRVLILGVLRNEPFYHSMPSSYWRELLADPLRGARPNGWFGETRDASKELQEGGAGAVPVLAVLIHDPDPRVAQNALGVLAWIGGDARSAIPALKELVQVTSNGGVSLLAGKILCRLEPETRNDVLTWQLNALRSKRTDEQLGRLFLEIGPKDRDLVPILVEMLDDAGQRKWHADIVQALMRVGSEARAAVPALARMLRDEDRRTKQTAIAALGKIGGNDTASTLGEALPIEEHVHSRRGIARALSDIGPAARVAAPALLQALKDADGTVRFFALVALVNADCVPDDAIAILAEKLTDEDGHIQYYAADALGRLGPKARAAVPALLGALKDPNDFVPQHVADALKKVDPDAAAKAGIR